MKAFLKWVGGKTRIVNDIEQYMVECDFYIEPFVGGGSLFFKLKPKNALIADINANLINCYLIVRDNLGELIDILKKYDSEYKETDDNEKRAEIFYEKRKEYNKVKYYEKDLSKMSTCNRINCCALFIFLNKTAFNGLYRENGKGEYNVPHGKYKNPCILDEKNLLDVSRYLKEHDITIKCCGYKEVYDGIDILRDKYSNITIYNDPPYYQSDTSKFISYTKDVFGKNEQKELRDTILEHNDKANILVSNSNCDGVIDLYKDFFTIHEIIVNRSISSKKSTRGEICELLITNYIVE